MAPSNMCNGSFWISDHAESIVPQPLETARSMADELTQQILQTEYCIVMDSGLSYPMYDDWIMHNFDEYRDNFIYNHDIDDIQKDRLYKIIGHAPHGNYDRELYLIQDMDTEQVFIIEEEGIEKCNDVLVSTKNIDTIMVDCNIQRSVYENMLKGEERNMNNKIVDLYYERKKKELSNRYEEIVETEYEALDVVKEYNEIINTFNTSLAELANRYNSEEVRVLLKTGYKNTYEYELSFDLKDHIASQHRDEYEAELKKLELLIEEVRAMLAFSDNEEYRLNVLKQYDIVDKKGKLNT